MCVPTWDLRVMLPTLRRLVSFIWLKLRRLICLSFLLWVILNPPSPHIPSLSVAPAMTHLAYIRIYLTPKNKKRIMWTATNKTFSYSDMSGSCFPASGVSLMQPIWESLSSHRFMPNWATASWVYISKPGLSPKSSSTFSPRSTLCIFIIFL